MPYIYPGDAVRNMNKLDKLRNRIAELKAENKRMKGNIPSYEPPPCECCRKFTDYYAAECDCQNLGDHEAAVRWCVRMDIADSFQEILDNGEGG